MTSFLFEGMSARGRCQNLIKCDGFACETAMKYVVTFDPERTFNQQHFLNVWVLAAV